MKIRFYEIISKLFSKTIKKTEVKSIIEYCYDQKLVFNWHPLGFIHIKLYENEAEKSSLRLHIWPSEQRKYQEPKLAVHDHIFAMSSYVVVGIQTNVIYDVRNDSNQPNGKLYTVVYGKEESKLIDTGRSVFYEIKSKDIYYKDQIYDMTTAQFHESDVADHQITCTLVAIKNELPRNPAVIGPLNGDKEYVYLRGPCPTDVSNGLLEKIFSSI